MRFVAGTAAFLFIASAFFWRCQVFVDSQDLDSSLPAYDGIPIIDIRPWTRPNESTATVRAAIARAVGDACTEIGFFAVTGHTVNASTIHNAWKASADFFDLPLETKLASKTDNEKEYPYGYEHSERLQLGKLGGQIEVTLPDLKETFSLGPSNPEAGMPPRRFPADPPEFKKALEVYYSEMEALAITLLKISAVALELPEDWFENKMDHHLGALRILNYCPVDRTAVQPGAIRASAHTDYGALTILRSGGPGLQVKKDTVESDESDIWIDVPSIPDAFIINIGDMMQSWTNGTYREQFCTKFTWAKQCFPKSSQRATFLLF
jgi:isopenicillin N synthase-like dioxygenase